MRKSFEVIVTLALLLFVLVFGYPFAQDAYHWWQVKQRLAAVMTSTEKAEFQSWQGDAASFARTLYERCQLAQGKGAVQCERYHSAFE